MPGAESLNVRCDDRLDSAELAGRVCLRGEDQLVWASCETADPALRELDHPDGRCPFRACSHMGCVVAQLLRVTIGGGGRDAGFGFGGHKLTSVGVSRRLG